jgi:hypothetical protein
MWYDNPSDELIAKALARSDGVEISGAMNDKEEALLILAAAIRARLSPKEVPMAMQKVIATLRNPYGFSDDDVKQARLDASTMLEDFYDAYENLRAYANANGLNTTATR